MPTCSNNNSDSATTTTDTNCNILSNRNKLSNNNNSHHVSSHSDNEDDNEEAEAPPLIPAGCSCKWCMKWTVCEHTVLVASVFSAAYKVPDNLVAETTALRKKTSSIRGTAGLRRKLVIKEISRQKKQSTYKLA